jgi:hypothetical protein
MVPNQDHVRKYSGHGFMSNENKSFELDNEVFHNNDRNSKYSKVSVESNQYQKEKFD